jgi:hypothetical protein
MLHYFLQYMYLRVRFLISDTKAVLTCDVDYFIKREERTQFKNAQLAARYAAPPLIPPAVSRWKWAFKDLSKGKAEPIVIRTRHGKLRVANALEDCQRSWTRHPSGMDMIFNADKLVRLCLYICIYIYI